MKNIVRSRIIASLFLLVSIVCLCSCASKKEPLSSMDYINALVDAGFPIENIIEKPADPEFFKYTQRYVFADSRVIQYNSEYPVGGEIQIYETKEIMHESLHLLEEIYATTPSIAMRIISAPDELAILLIEFDLNGAQADEYKIAFEEFCKDRKITKKFGE